MIEFCLGYIFGSIIGIIIEACLVASGREDENKWYDKDEK